MNKLIYQKPQIDEYSEKKGNYLVAFLAIGVGVIFLTTAISVIFYFLFCLITKTPFNFNRFLDENAFMGLKVLASAVAEVVGIILLVFVLKSDLKTDLKNFKTYFLQNVGIILAMVLLMFLSLNVVDFIISQFKTNNDSQNQKLIETLFKSDIKYVMIFSTVILAPIYEELIFRKSFDGLLRKVFRFPKILAFLSVSIFFAAFHVFPELAKFDFLAFVPYFVLSCFVTGSYYLTRKNVFVSMVVHFINNLIVTIFILF